MEKMIWAMKMVGAAAATMSSEKQIHDTLFYFNLALLWLFSGLIHASLVYPLYMFHATVNYSVCSAQITLH